MALLRLRLFCFAGLIATPVLCGSIEGRVTNSATGEPVVNADVRFIDPHSYVFSTATDASGMYHITGLAEGDYRSEFQKDGFSEDRLAPNRVHVAGETPAHADAQLRPFGKLRGRVIDEEGKPAKGVAVEFSRGVDDTTLTDANGGFAFQVVEPGSYTVVAKPMPATRMRDGERVGAVPVYYPSAIELSDAVPIAVKEGADVAGIEIRLRDVPVHRVSGVVLDEAGKPVAHAAVKLLGRAGPRAYLSGNPAAGRRDPEPVRPPPGLPPEQLMNWMMASIGSAGSVAGPGPEAEVAMVETGEDGKFAFDAVAPGDWRISALTGEFGWKPSKAVVSVGVGEKDVDDVQIEIHPPFFIDVQADWGNAAPHPVMVNLAAMEGASPMLFDPSGPPPDLWPVLAGRYRVTGANVREPGYYVSSITLGGAEVLGQVVDLEPGAGPFRVTLKHDSGSLRGHAEKGQGATAFLVSRETGELVHVRSAKCGAGGEFAFSGLPPGDYYAVVFDHASEDRIGNALPARDLPASIASMATGVRVEAGAETMVEVRANAWPYF